MHPEEEDKLTTSSRWTTRPSFDRMNLEIKSDHYFMLSSWNFLSWNADTFVSLSFLSFSHFSPTMVVHHCANFYIHYHHLFSMLTLSSPFPSEAGYWQPGPANQWFCRAAACQWRGQNHGICGESVSVSGLVIMTYIIREAGKRCSKPLSATEVFQHDVHPFLRIPICCATQLQLTWLKKQQYRCAAVMCQTRVEVWNGCMGWSLSLRM